MAKKSQQLKTSNVSEEVDINFEFGIVRVANQGFYVNESIVIKDPFDIAYTLKISFNTEKEFIDFTVGAVYKNKEENHFMSSSALTQFFVKGLKRFVEPGSPSSITLPDGLMLMLFSISFTHARAIQAVNVASTKFSSFVLPIINPAEVYNQIMVEMGFPRGDMKAFK